MNPGGSKALVEPGRMPAAPDNHRSNGAVEQLRGDEGEDSLPVACGTRGPDSWSTMASAIVGATPNMRLTMNPATRANTHRE
jgi:hypothetical protein